MNFFRYDVYISFLTVQSRVILTFWKWLEKAVLEKYVYFQMWVLTSLISLFFLGVAGKA